MERKRIAIFAEKLYEAVNLRFQQLLGDFTEGSFTVLPESERENLIQCCI